MEHLNLKLSADRPCTRKLSTLPHEHGFNFYGIGKEGRRYRCSIAMLADNMVILGSKSAAKDTLIGWQPTK